MTAKNYNDLSTTFVKDVTSRAQAFVGSILDQATAEAKAGMQRVFNGGAPTAATPPTNGHTKKKPTNGHAKKAKPKAKAKATKASGSKPRKKPVKIDPDQVVEILTQEGPLGRGELARRIGASESATYNMLTTLLAEGRISKSGARRTAKWGTVN